MNNTFGKIIDNENKRIYINDNLCSIHVIHNHCFSSFGKNLDTCSLFKELRHKITRSSENEYLMALFSFNRVFNEFGVITNNRFKEVYKIQANTHETSGLFHIIDDLSERYKNKFICVKYKDYSMAFFAKEFKFLELDGSRVIEGCCDNLIRYYEGRNYKEIKWINYNRRFDMPLDSLVWELDNQIVYDKFRDDLLSTTESIINS